MRKALLSVMVVVCSVLQTNQLQSQTLPSYLPSNGLVAWYPFNGNANDESGNGNHGTVNGATLTADRNGNSNGAYFFDGNSRNIVVQNSNSLNPNEITINCWVNALADNVCIMEKSDPTNATQAGFGITHNDFFQVQRGLKSMFSSGYCNGTTSIEFWGEYEVITNGNWNMITVQIDINGNIRHFSNGILLATYVASSSLISCNSTSSNIRFGGPHWNGDPEWFQGILDDIAIYNRALTQEEITALYTGTSSNNNGGGGSGSTAGTPAESVPAGIPYQAVIRDNEGMALVNTPVSVRFTLHENTTSGTTEYQETQSLTTNALGLINTQFGVGTATQGTYAGINWSNTTKFIQVEANTGAGYVDLGTQQMMSVPFAIQANKATAIKNAGLPVYADNAAALAGGLVAGEMYRTANGDLKIVF